MSIRKNTVTNSMVSVPIEPTANSSNSIVNTINITQPQEPERVVYKPEIVREIKQTQPESKRPETLETFLLKLYESILLSGDKELLANIVSREKIIIAKNDLEKAISLKTGKQCVISFEEPSMGCCGADFPKPFIKITQIRLDNDTVDFKVAYNKEYCEISDKYKISLKYCLNF
jgi:hypothetical protein